MLVTQLCRTLCNPTNCGPPGFSVHGILHGEGSHSLLQEIFPIQGSKPGWKQMGCSWSSPSSSQLLQPSPAEPQRKPRRRKRRILASGHWGGAYQRSDFNWPRLLHLPTQRKVLNSLSWDFWFSLIVIFWCSTTWSSAAKKSPEYPNSLSWLFFLCPGLKSSLLSTE